MGSDPAPGRDGRRRADARHARADLQSDRKVLRGAGSVEGERRRAARRRLRASARSASGSVEPVDRAARKPCRLPHAPHGQEVSSAVRHAHRARDQPQSGVARRRGVPPPNSLQDRRERPDARAVREDFRAQLRTAKPPFPSSHGRLPAAAPLHAAEPSAARVPSARPAGPGHRVVPVSGDRTLDYSRAARRRVRVVLHRRARAKYAASPSAEEGAPAAGGPLKEDRYRSLRELFARAMICALFTFLCVNLLRDFMQTGRVTGLLLLVSELLVVVLTFVRRPAGLVDRSLWAGLVTAISLAGPPMVRAVNGSSLLPDLATASISAAGLTLVIVGKVVLG